MNALRTIAYLLALSPLVLGVSVVAPVAVLQEGLPVPAPVAEVPEIEAQGPTSSILGGALSVSHEPTSYFSATSAVVVKQGDGVLVFTEDLAPARTWAEKILVENGKVTWVEAYKNGQAPGSVIDQLDGMPGVFLVPGAPGDAFNVRIPNGWEKPEWIEFVIQGPGGEDPGDPTDPDKPDPIPDPDLEELSRARSGALNDPYTAAKLKGAIAGQCDAIDALCKTGDCPDLAQAQTMMVAVIEGVMAARRGDSEYVAWREGWRTPIGDAIKARNPRETPAYVALMRSVAAGL